MDISLPQEICLQFRGKLILPASPLRIHSWTKRRTTNQRVGSPHNAWVKWVAARWNHSSILKDFTQNPQHCVGIELPILGIASSCSCALFLVAEESSRGARHKRPGLSCRFVVRTGAAVFSVAAADTPKKMHLCAMWVASPWELSEKTIQPARHECHACCPLQAEKLGIQPVVGNTRGTHDEQVVSSFLKILRGSQLTWYTFDSSIRCLRIFEVYSLLKLSFICLNQAYSTLDSSVGITLGMGMLESNVL